MAGYKSPFANTKAGKKAAEGKKKPEKDKWFWEKWGNSQGDAAADHLLDMHKKSKKK